MPAEPWANVENSRRTTSETTRWPASAASPERVPLGALSSGLEFDDSALQPSQRDASNSRRQGRPDRVDGKDYVPPPESAGIRHGAVCGALFTVPLPPWAGTSIMFLHYVGTS